MHKIIILLALTLLSSTSWSQSGYLSDKELSKRTVFDLKEAVDKKNKTVSLFLSDSSITTFPLEIFHLKKLQSLLIIQTKIETIPFNIGSLENLHQLDLSRNKHLNLHQCIEGLNSIKNLQELSLVKCEISELPVNIGSLNNLKKLILYWNKIEKLPSEIGNLRSLNVLLLEGNNLSELPTEITQLTELETITINNNLFNSLPEELEHLPQLKYLYFGNRNMDFDKSFETISRCYSLEYVHISGARLNRNNQIEILKNSKNLKKIVLIDSFESIEDIPEGLKMLKCKIVLQTKLSLTQEEVLNLKKMNPKLEINLL